MSFQSVPEIIRQWGRQKPDAVAISSPTRDWTFGDIDQASNRVARGLRALGIGPGDRVAALTRQTAECQILFMGASKVGAVLAPLNWRLAVAELDYVANHCEAQLIMADQAFMENLTRVTLIRARKIVVTEGDGGDSFLGWASSFDATDPGHQAAPDDTALQLYSSGTTGKPKGVELSHANLMFQCNVISEHFGYRRGEPSVLLDALPTFHVSGIVNTLTMLHEAAVTVTRPEFVPQDIVDAINRHGVTNTFLVPTMMRMLAQSVTATGTRLPSLRAVGYGGSPVSETVLNEVRDALGCGLIQVFGMTELGGMATCLAAEDHDDAEKLRSAGKPLTGVKLRIVNIADLSPCAEGEVGELWVQSGSVMTGYFRNPEASRETLPELPGAGRWLRTGDICCLKDGYLYIRDRLKEMVISGGENIYPAEVENVIASHPAVADVAIIGVPDPLWGEAVKACVVLKAGATATPAEIIAYSRENLAHYKCPKSVDIVTTLPRNPSGKLLKRVLREPYWQGQGGPTV